MTEDLKSIYAIECPLTNRVVYIGQAWSVKTRRLMHRNKNSQHKGKINAYIQYILNSGFEPLIYEIDEIPASESHFWEVFYMQTMQCWGFDLLNIQKNIKKQFYDKND